MSSHPPISLPAKFFLRSSFFAHQEDEWMFYLYYVLYFETKKYPFVYLYDIISKEGGQ